MSTYAVTIAYDGTHYCGFQVQPNGITIQQRLMEASIDLFGDAVTVTGSSRTDAGVHARGQVIRLTTPKNISADKLPMALNVRLPKDIVAISAYEVDDQWHPRYQPHVKTYQYHVITAQMMYPWEQDYAYHFTRELKIDRMTSAAKLLVGKHDFNAYAAAKKSVEDTVRTIQRLELIKTERGLIFEIEGDGFLYNMVRIIVGTLLMVGTGQIDEQQILASLATGERDLAGPTAPAKGLFLYEINYMA